MKDQLYFSHEVCQELKYYVYRLVDPTNGETFYVGRGKDNRVFEHVKYAISGSMVGDSIKMEQSSNDSLKIKKIREIYNAGLEVIHIIQKYGLEERDAKIIESVLIDVYSIDNKLTNEIKGYDSYKGPTNAKILEKIFALPEYEDGPINPEYIIIKIKDYWLNQRDNDRYETTRSSWKINPKKAAKYPFVFSVTNSIVREAYRVKEWIKVEGSERYEFIGEIAEEAIRCKFVDKKIPSKYRVRGQASPYLYSRVD